MEALTIALKWIFVSSADPKKVSLTIQAVGIWIVGYAVRILAVTCMLHYFCSSLDATALGQIVNAFSDVVFWALSGVAVISGAVGLIRKLVRTVQGTNLAVQ